MTTEDIHAATVREGDVSVLRPGGMDTVGLVSYVIVDPYEIV